MLLTNTQVSELRKDFENGLSANMKLQKTWLHKIRQSGGFLGELLGPLVNTGLPLMKNALKPFAQSVLIPLVLTESASATDSSIHKKMFGSGTRLLDLANWKTLIISNEEMNDVMKIIKSLEESGLLIKSISETTKNGAKEQEGEFIVMLLGNLGAGLLGNLLTGKSAIRAGESAIATSQRRGTIRAGQDF